MLLYDVLNPRQAYYKHIFTGKLGWVPTSPNTIITSNRKKGKKVTSDVENIPKTNQDTSP
jgi:hypothetical protein